MKDELFEWRIEESRLRGKRMSRDRRCSGRRVETESFRCKCCGALVLRATYISGVLNRNHCPYCLSSRHVDWQRAGDRMSACKGKMRPVGLALKRNRNKYTADSGELMVIHVCEDCGQVSANRIAADDCTDTLLALFENNDLLTESIRANLRSAQISWLTEEKIGLVRRRLFGMEEVYNTAPAGAVP
ncbi:MAG: RNHCP domain-containing protein [Anaerolineaceae bacterium]|nr:RNHCP domain-containing protein [Anaerolineaceae bacterium]